MNFDSDELSACVNCGLCLPHCPTYRVSGEEVMSPRGRIGLMRLVDEGAPVDDTFINSMDTCVQCMGCMTACPAGVQYERLISTAKHELASDHKVTPRWLRVGLGALKHQRLLAATTPLLALAQRLRLVPKRIGMPRLGFKNPKLQATGTDVWFFQGCVMDAWQRSVHVDTLRVLEAGGIGAEPLGGLCCGALHSHAGLEANSLLEGVIAAADDDRPILVNSAGCGAQLKHAGEAIGTPEAKAFSERVFDVHEYLVSHGSVELKAVNTNSQRVTVQDPCHLRHLQNSEAAVWELLEPLVELVELDDQGLCCGAGGAYSVVQPELSVAIRARKTASIERSGAELVVSANPGCSMHLAAAGHNTIHPMSLLAEIVCPEEQS